ncbi:MAG: ATP-binding protein [Thermodesulfobacteriota bacterium]
MDSRMIFSVCPEEEYFGRSKVIEDIYDFATSSVKPPFGIYLVGKRWMGKTEVLKRVYHRLFRDQEKVVPFYYRFKTYYTVEDFVYDYLKNFSRQYLAFLERDPAIVREEFTIEKLERTLRDRGCRELSCFLALYRRGEGECGKMSTLRGALAAPFKTALLHDTPLFLSLDDFHHSARIPLHEGGAGILGEYMKALMSGAVSYLVTGYVKKIAGSGVFPGAVKSIELAALDREASYGLMEEMCRRHSVNYDGDVLTVAAEQLGGNPAYLKSVVGAASQKGRRGLITIKEFIDIYVDEVVEGSIALSLASAITLQSLDTLRLLHTCIRSQTITDEELMEDRAYDSEGIRDSLAALGDLYLLDVDCGLVRWIGDRVMEDYVTSLYEARVEGRSMAEIKARLAREKLKEGFSLQGGQARGNIEGEVQELIGRFNGQRIPQLLFRNQDFLAWLNEKGADGVYDGDVLPLPHVAGCSGKREGGFTILVAHGFSNGRYDSDNEVRWIVGVKETPASVHLGDVESFIRRCGAVKGGVGASGVKIVRWMVGREGFTGEALKRLNVEGIYTTDGRQLDIMRDLIAGREKELLRGDIGDIAPLKEFEIVLPMSGRAELVAARAVEEVGGEMGFEQDTTDQIKTALVEACINAIEHSKVKHGKVYCRFVVGNDRLILHIKNSGREFDWNKRSKGDSVVNLSGHSRRGRGIEMMRKLMDEVRFEKMRDGTKLVMVKYLKRERGGRDERRN